MSEKANKLETQTIVAIAPPQKESPLLKFETYKRLKIPEVAIAFWERMESTITRSQNT